MYFPAPSPIPRFVKSFNVYLFDEAFRSQVHVMALSLGFMIRTKRSWNSGAHKVATDLHVRVGNKGGVAQAHHASSFSLQSPSAESTPVRSHSAAR